MNFEDLKKIVSEGYAGIRLKIQLQPGGGEGTKIFPPTYAVEKGSPSLYAWEERRICGEKVPCVLLDSIQSQANRMELAIQEAWEEKRLSLPVIQTDFSEKFPELGTITSFEAPHRVYDAIFRDSITAEGTPFRESPAGQELEAAVPQKATALFKHCPAALVFGAWNSTGAQGGMGSKFQRIITSEIMAINAVAGVSSSSRLDPLGIKRVEIFKGKDKNKLWTLDENDAARKKDKIITMKASDVNHSNFPPTLAEDHGGITMDHAELTFVLSLPALRRLKFPLEEGKTSHEINCAAQTVLAALALTAITLEIEQGFDLRSKCLLYFQGVPTFEIISNYGEITPLKLKASSAVELFNRSLRNAAAQGLPWEKEPLALTPSEKLIQLISKSRATESADEE